MKNSITLHTNQNKNIAKVFQESVTNNDVENFIIIGRYKSGGLFMYKSDMTSEEEINLSAQLSAKVQNRFISEALAQDEYSDE